MITAAIPTTPTGADLIIEAGRYVATRARRVHMSAHRALLAVLIGETDPRKRECLEMACAWFDQNYGAGSMHALIDESAAGALTACGCAYAIELREAMRS